MKLNDAVFGLLLLLLGSAVLVAVQGYPQIPGQQVGPALFPGIIAAGLCVAGLVLVARGWRARATTPWFTLDDWVRSPRHLLAFFVALGSVLFYIQVSETLGFIITSALILGANFWVLKVPPARALLVAVLATLLIHLAFYKGLRVPLPWGVLKSIAW